MTIRQGYEPRSGVILIPFQRGHRNIGIWKLYRKRFRAVSDENSTKVLGTRNVVERAVSCCHVECEGEQGGTDGPGDKASSAMRTDGTLVPPGVTRSPIIRV